MTPKEIDGHSQRSSDLVFHSTLKDLSTRKWFDPCLKEANIPDYVWHCNRYTFCSWLSMKGASLKEIQEAAGHRTITTSAKYAHLSPEHNNGVVDRIAGIPQSEWKRRKGKQPPKQSPKAIEKPPIALPNRM
jgi:site-specific recombinase XerD